MLQQAPSLEDIKAHINTFKIKALNLAMRQISDLNSIHLEPREIKTLVEVTLNIEDSLATQKGEGEQARQIKRLLDKYSTDEYSNDMYTSNHNKNTTAPTLLERDDSYEL